MNYTVKQQDVKELLERASAVVDTLVNKYAYTKCIDFLIYYSNEIKLIVPKDLIKPHKVTTINDVNYLDVYDVFEAFSYITTEEAYIDELTKFIAEQYNVAGGVYDVLDKKKRNKLYKQLLEDIASKLDEQYNEYEKKGYVINLLPSLVTDEMHKRREEARATKLENLQKRNKGGRKSAFTDIDEDTLIMLLATKTDKEIEARDDIKASLSTIRGMRRKLALKYVVNKDEKLEQIKQDLKEYKGNKELEDALKAERKEVKASDNVAYDKRSKALITDTDEHLETFIKQALSRRNVL